MKILILRNKNAILEPLRDEVGVDSLNVGVSAGIVLYEKVRQEQNLK